MLKVPLTPMLTIRQKLKKYDNHDNANLMRMMRIRMVTMVVVTSVCVCRSGCWYHNAIVATSFHCNGRPSR